ncbi:MAG: acetyltransferase [Candidatus Protistobacter heckmanni]|nr:acetyltransferase [Candidatus Protistobacter heckmanni]
MTMLPILLVGAGGHARSCIDVIEQEGRFDVTGLLGTVAEIGSSVLGYPVVGSDAELEAMGAKARHAIVGVGQIKTPDIRMQLFQRLESGGWELPVLVSPRAYVSPHASLGPGTIVMHGAAINAGAIVGRNCILNSMALVEHDAVVADHCHIATAATVNGGAKVGEGSFVGSGAVIQQGAEIGRRCVIGMGQNVLADCHDGSWMPDSARPK